MFKLSSKMNMELELGLRIRKQLDFVFAQILKF